MKAEAYAMLEIVTDVVEHLEDAGDEMGTAFGAYQLGRRSYNGGGSIGRLVQAVISFLNRWRTGKERFEQLSARQEALRANLRELDGALPAAQAPKPGVACELDDGLEALSACDLKAALQAKKLEGYSSLTKPALIARLRGGEVPEPRSSPSKAAPTAIEIASLEARLDRMEALLVRIAEHLDLS